MNFHLVELISNLKSLITSSSSNDIKKPNEANHEHKYSNIQSKNVFEIFRSGY